MSDTYIGYLRVSTDKQKKSGLGIASQRTNIQTYAKLRGHTIVDWEKDEAKSGKSTDNRDGLDRAIKACEAGLADGIVIAQLDRLIRNFADYARLVEEAEQHGYKLIALEYEGMDPDNPMTEFMQGIGALRSQLDRRIISVRTKQALAELQARGVKLGRPHSQPISIRKYARRLRAQGYTVDEAYMLIRQRATRPPSRATVARMMNDVSIAMPNIAAEALAATNNGKGAP